MRRVFKTRYFTKQAAKSKLTDDMLCRAIEEMVAGLHDGDLGGHVWKKRIGLAGQGKRSGARTLIATNQANRWFFLY